ncbi:MAG: hypothetical protein R3C10_11805, partial [Pirellulales bacterium]
PVPFEMTVKEKSTIHFAFDSPTDIETVISDYVSHIQDFLTLAMRVTVPIGLYATMTGDIGGPGNIDGDGNRRIRVYYPPAVSSDVTSVLPEWHRMLFRFADIVENVGLYVQTWFARSEIIRTITPSLFAHRYFPTVYTEVEFIDYARALESYHRAISQERDTHYKDRVADVLGRVAEIDERVVSDVKSTAELTKNTRNYLTHRNPQQRDRAANGSELRLLTTRLELVLEICLLLEMGMAPDLIREIVTNQRQIGRRRAILSG